MLVGRGRELARLVDLVRAVAAGAGSALVVRGAAGVGKSTLLQQVTTGTHARELRATGVQSESRMAFAGLHELLQPVLAEVDRLPPLQRAQLRRCLSLEAGDTEERHAHVALTMLVAELGRTGPLLCVVDDAQWPDESSADAVLFAARRQPESVGFLFGVRDGVPSRFDESWLAQLTVGPLSEQDGLALLDHEVPELNPAVRARIAAAGEGNPLALLEFAR